MGNIYKINVKDGSLIWDKKNTVSFYSQIKIFNNKIYQIQQNGEYYSIQTHTPH